MRQFLWMTSLLAAMALVGCNQSSNSASNAVTQPASAGDTSNTSAPAGPGVLAPQNTKIEFVGTKKGGKEEGSFTRFSGTIKPIDKDFTASQISLDIDADSLTTATDKLTNHLKSPDFFDVKKYSKATFVSTKIEVKKTDDATHVITGDLTLHGTTKSISIPAKVAETEDTLTLDGTFTFDRTDYGIAFNPQMVDAVVTVKVSAKVPRK